VELVRTDLEGEPRPPVLKKLQSSVEPVVSYSAQLGWLV
jgi:hypothetical protein